LMCSRKAPWSAKDISMGVVGIKYRGRRLSVSPCEDVGIYNIFFAVAK
jgi:hypothetical protein